MGYQIIKNLFDRCFAFFLLILLTPIFILVSITNYLFLGSPILFTQIRPGLNKKPFKIYKFRSMKNIRKKNLDFQSDKSRITKYGNFLRKTSIDEIPSLFNILKGELSFIGPRPLLMEYLPLYSSEHSRRHDVKPGLTGWAAINGRNNIDWETKLDMDIWYIKNMSLFLDLKIFLLTFFKVLKREGVNTKSGDFMPNLKKNYNK